MKIDRFDDMGGAILNFAVRYALGRSSYAPGLVVDEIIPMLPNVSGRTLAVFDNDVASWLDGGSDCGVVSQIDRDIWRRFLKTVRKEIESRKESVC